MLTAVLTVTNINVGWLQERKDARVIAEDVMPENNDKEETEPKVVKEIKKERTENTNTYLLSDGSKKMEIFAEDIRYKEEGRWKNYDTSFISVDETDMQELKDAEDAGSEYAYTNAQGQYKQYFAESINEDTPVIMTNAGYEISFSPSRSSVNGESVMLEGISRDSESEIVYSNEDDSIKYEYISLTNGVKENIVLNRKPESNIFEFTLRLTGMNAEMNRKANQICITDEKTGELSAVIAAPNVINRAGKADYDSVKHKLKKNDDGTYKLSVIVDEEYLSRTSYPITIDPTYLWITDTMMDYGATMSEGEAATSVLGKTDSIVLMNGTDNKARLYVRFKGLNEQLRGKYVYQSYFRIYTKTVMGDAEIGVSQVLEDWQATTLTWNNQPDISETIYDEQSEFTADASNIYMLTGWTKEIASGAIDNDYGIALSCISEESNDACVNLYGLFYSGKQASLYVYYKDVEEVNCIYDGSFEVRSKIEDNQVKLSWESYSDDIYEYDIYARTGDSFEYMGRTTGVEYTVEADSLEENTDIRVIAVETSNPDSYFSAKNYLSNIISIEKFESVETDDEENEVVKTVYEESRFDTDGDGLEDGYEIWDLGTKWNEEAVNESSESTEGESEEEIEKEYVLDSDGDGFPDSYEVFILGTDPAVANTNGIDSDGDSLSDSAEYVKGTDPHLKDSDFDGTNDNGESKADARYTENSTSELKALNAEAYTGLYDFEHTETEDGVTITRLVNVYSGIEKKVVYNYGDENLNKEKLYFYDEDQNNTAVIEKINSYDAEDSSESEKNVICITYAYNDSGYNTLICDQKTRYTMSYDEEGNMKEIKVGDISLMEYSGQILQDNSTSDGNTDSIEKGGIIRVSEKTQEYGNGQKIRIVTTIYKVEEDAEETSEEEDSTIEGLETTEESETESTVATKTEIFYNENTEVSYVAEYDTEGELIRFTDYTSEGETPVVYEYTTGENGTTVSRNGEFTKTVTTTDDETNSKSTDTTVYSFKDIKGTDRTYTHTLTVDTSEDNDIDANAALYNGDKSDYVFNYENDITTRRIYSEETDAEAKLVSTETHGSDVSATYEVTDADGTRTFSYTYDLAGNITQVKEGTVVKSSYTYDGHGRLLTETDFTENVQHKYVYNSTGNIKAHWTYSLDENGNTVESGADVKYFTHTNADWPDQVTTYDGQSLTYDSSGNPLTYRDGLTFTWTRGRMLEQVKLNGAVSAYYKYNQEGLRTYKDTADMTTVYEWDNTNLIRETVTYKLDSKVYDIWYLYAGNGDITGFVYEYLNADGNVESQTVYYEKNIQGDIIALLNFSGEKIAQYSYDAWGNVTESTYEAGCEVPYNLNHIGYRGYYRDNETGFYYLQSRYYDAKACRFINADDAFILKMEGKDIYKDNMYIYCNSNPIINIDETGRKSKLTKKEENAKKIIQNNKSNILGAATQYGVDPAIVAGVIYAEQVLNVDKMDYYTDWLGYYGVNTSVGIGQVRIKTAKMLDKKKYVVIKNHYIFNVYVLKVGNSNSDVYDRLIWNDINIIYVTAYLKYMQDVWKKDYKKIASSPDILGTLYNIGKTESHSNPKANSFGKYVKKVQERMKKYLGVKKA